MIRASHVHRASWLNEAPNQIDPHKNGKIINGRAKCLNGYFSYSERRAVNT